MKANTRNWLIWSAAVVIVVGGVLVYASPPETVRWKEEVRRHNGHLFVVERSVTFGGPHEIGQPPSPSRWTLTFSTPGTESQAFSFESAGGEEPMLVDFDGATPYLAVYLATGAGAYKHRCPNPPYIFFRHKESNWQEIPLSEFPKKFSAANFTPFTDEMMRRARRWEPIAWQENLAYLQDRHILDSRKRILRPFGDRTIYGQYGCPSRG